MSSTDAAIGTPCSCSIDVEQAVEPESRPRQRMPADEEAPERRRFDRLDFLPQPRQRSLPHRAQHFGVAPLAAAAARPELAVDDAAARHQTLQRGIDHRHAEAEARADVLARERPCVRPKRRTRSTTGSATGSSSVTGSPGGSGTPIASRYRAASSTAMIRSSPAMRTASARRVLTSSSIAGSAMPASLRGSISSRDRSPSRSSRSWTASVDRAWKRAAGAAAPARACRARIRRADRAARCRRSGRAAAIDRPTAPARAVRPAAHRRRRCSWRRSRTAATPRTATASATRR